MSSGTARKKGKKNRCHGRNKDFCKSYAARGQREKNKKVRLRKHLAKHTGDKVAQAAFDRL